MRTRMVTRTINFTTVKAMTVNTENATVENKTITIVGDYKGKELEKLIKNEIENATTKFVSILDTYNEEQIYGMTEQEFVSLARIITR